MDMSSGSPLTLSLRRTSHRSRDRLTTQVEPDPALPALTTWHGCRVLLSTNSPGPHNEWVCADRRESPSSEASSAALEGRKELSGAVHSTSIKDSSLLALLLLLVLGDFIHRRFFFPVTQHQQAWCFSVLHFLFLGFGTLWSFLPANFHFFYDTLFHHAFLHPQPRCCAGDM